VSDQARVRILSVLVEDGSGTLSKISGLIRRRGRSTPSRRRDIDISGL
jgi:acetolactate synthase small subunit